MPSPLHLTDEVSKSAGMGSLHDAVVGSSESEIRVWVGFGMQLPNRMLRLRVNATGMVSGEVLYYFPRDLEYGREEDAVKFREQMTRIYSNFRLGESSEFCSATFSSQPDWPQIHRDLVDGGVTTLPHESTLSKHYSFDGVAVLVEVRNGSSYRAYQYKNPHFRSESEARAADRIIQLVESLTDSEERRAEQ